MIQVHIEGASWLDVRKQLSDMVAGIETQTNVPASMEELEDHLADVTAEKLWLEEKVEDLTAQLSRAEEELERLSARCKELEEKLEGEGCDKPDANPSSAATHEDETPNSAAPTEPVPAAETAPDPAGDDPEGPTYDKIAVRTFLAECRNKGVNITEVLKPFGGQFTAVSADRYPELMDAARKALAEKEAK